MATLPVQQVPVRGLANVAFAAANAGGDDVPSGVASALLVRNTDATAKTVTITTPGTVDGLAIEDPAVIVPATTGFAVIPLVGRLYGASVLIAYSAVTGVTVAAIQLAR